MPQRVHSLVEIKMRQQIKAGRVDPVEEPVNGTAGVFGDAVNLNPITGGNQDDFGQAGANFEPASEATQLGVRHGQALAHFDGRGLVTQTYREEFHTRVPFI